MVSDDILGIEDRAADEFSQDRIAGDPVVGDILEILQELDQPVCLDEVRTFTGNLLQQRQHVLFDDAQLVGQLGIEHEVRLRLVGIDPLEFTSANAGPHIKGLLAGGVSGGVIPCHSSE